MYYYQLGTKKSFKKMFPIDNNKYFTNDFTILLNYVVG